MYNNVLCLLLVLILPRVLSLLTSFSSVNLCCSLPTGKDWIKQMIMSSFLIPGLTCGTAFLINFIAIYYHASRAIPFGTMVSHEHQSGILHCASRTGTMRAWESIYALSVTALTMVCCLCCRLPSPVSAASSSCRWRWSAPCWGATCRVSPTTPVESTLCRVPYPRKNGEGRESCVSLLSLILQCIISTKFGDD